MNKKSMIAVEVESVDEAGFVAPASNGQTPAGRWRPIPVVLLLSVFVVAVYAAYERIGTTANANSVEYTQNLAGGFLAVGMTEDQPGFIVLSVLDQDKVDVNAVQTKNRAAGTHTVVEVHTPLGTKSTRLRGPQVILVTKQGAVEQYNVDWTVEEFNTLREAADCSHEAAIKKHRCGRPFTDLQEAFAKWPRDRVPDRVRAFLEPFRDRPRHKSKG
ncbi:MAG: hypothetical protein IIB60_02760 [Planctomycetes bacterium]|nr:hypothetical protein [Planctomycetota bacterium]